MSSPVVWPACVVIAVSAGSVAVLLVRRGAHAAVVGGALVAAAAGIWIVGLSLQLSSWRDTDGWVDCYPSCNGWHATGAVLFWAPPFAALVSVGAVLVVWATRRRRISAGRGRP